VTALVPVAGELPGGWEQYARGMGDALSLATAGWLAACNSANTREAYLRNLCGLGRNWEPAPGKAPAWLPWCHQNGVDPLTARRSHVEAWSRMLEQAGFAAKSRAQKLATVSSWYDYLESEELTERNPAKKATRPRANGNYSPATALSHEEIDRLIDAAEADGPMAYALVCLLYFCGLRVGSILSAKVGDLAWDQGTRALNLTLKGGKPVRELLVPTAAEAVDTYLATRPGAGDSEPLFTNHAGGPLHRFVVRKLIQRLARQCGIESHRQLTNHGVGRATHITHARDEKVAVDVIQFTVKHADPRTTLSYDNLREARRERSGTALEKRRRRERAARGAS